MAECLPSNCEAPEKAHQKGKGKKKERLKILRAGYGASNP
jgi:hypothetical protein